MTERKDLSRESVREALIESKNMYNAMVEYSKSIAETVDKMDNEDLGIPEIPPVSSRLLMWSIFAEEVENHISSYTIPQYGDFPNDQMTTASASGIIHNMTRYINRIGSNARGDKATDQDLLKLAHYACILWCKRMLVEEELKKIIDEEVDIEETATADSTDTKSTSAD